MMALDYVDRRPPSQTALAMFGIEPQPVVPDANALIDDVIHYARRQLAAGRGYSRLTSLTDIGVARAFVPMHILEKVDLRLERALQDCGIDVGLGYEIWDTVLRPLLSAVELPPITDRDDPRVLAVLDADEEDASVAQLAVILAPALLLTRDRDLLDAGLGVVKWADALGLVQQIAAADSMVNGSARLAVGGLWAGGLAVRQAGRVLVRSPLLAGLALAIVFMLVTDWRESARGRLVDAGAKSKRVGTAIMEQLAEQYERREAAEAQLQALLVTPGEPSTIARVARELAVAGTRSVEQLAEVLGIGLNEIDGLLARGLIVGPDDAITLGCVSTWDALAVESPSTESRAGRRSQ